MAKRSHRKGPAHRAGPSDYKLMDEILKLPPRDSLPQEGPEKIAGYSSPSVTGFTLTPTTSIDNRSPERKAWDARYMELQKRLQKNSDAAKERRKKLSLARAIGADDPFSVDYSASAPAPASAEQAAEKDETNKTPVVRNGTQKAPAGGGAGSSQSKSESVLRPRGAQQTKVATVSPSQRLSASDTGVRANGAPVEAGDTATRGQIKSAQRDSATTDAIEAAETRRDAQTRAKSGDRRRAQQFIADQDALDAAAEARRERKRKEREAKEQTRRNKRFANRTLVNDDDWENLGRPGSDNVDYSDAKNADAKKEHDKRITELRDQLARLSDRTLVREGETATWEPGKFVGEGKTAKWEPGRMVVKNEQGGVIDASKRTTTGVGDDKQRYANDFYMYDPNRQRDLAGLRKLVEKGIKDGTITDAQIEGAFKTLDSWESAALDRRDAQVEREKFRNAERVRGLRKQYGMEDASLYDDPTVEAYHKQVQGARRKEILRTMAGGREDFDPESPSGFGKSWQQLLDAGFNPGEVLKTALGDPTVKKAYDDARMRIDTNTSLSDAEKVRRRDLLNHRTIMTRAFNEAGITGADVMTNNTAAGQNEDELKSEVAKYAGAKIRPPLRPFPVTVVTEPAEELDSQAELDGQSENAVMNEIASELEKHANAKILPPVSIGSNPTVEPIIKPKKDDEVGASLGGYAMSLLRPRRRS